MTAQLDHVVVMVPALAEAGVAFEAAGFTVLPGGRHDVIPTENALVVFTDGSYLELLAARDPATRAELRGLRAGGGWERHLRGVSAVARRFLPTLEGPDGVADWVMRSNALAEPAARLRASGIAAAGPVTMRRERPDGERLAWDLLLPDSRLHPFWIADRTPRPLRVPADARWTTHANGAQGVRAVRVRAASVPVAALDLANALDVRPALADDGGTVLDFPGWRVEVVGGEPAGATAVVLAGCEALPGALAAWGVLAGAR